MNVISLSFAAFICIIFALYYLLPHQNLLLLIASYIFLILWAWEFAAVTLLATLVNFYLAQQLEQRKDSRFVWSGVIFNVLLLVFFQEADFFAPNLAELLGINPGTLKILLPIGISFYTLQNISYLFDVQRGVTPATRNLLHFAIYTAYFPKLVSGPIERARTFLPQLDTPRTIDNEVLNRSFALMLNGLVRKLVIADPLLTLIPDRVFETPREFAAPVLILSLLAYAFALYNDFAGYTRLVRGISSLFGIELSPNFERPYFASSFTDFWSRWHMSLSFWLRDYIFMPITRQLLRKKYSREHMISLILPPMATMLVSGLWHDVSLNMLVWGGLHGLYQVIERYRNRNLPTNRKIPAWRTAISTLVIFTAVVLAWIPFRMSLPVAGDFLAGMITNLENTWPNLMIFPVILLSLSLDWIETGGEPVYLRMNKWVQAGLIALSVLAIFLGTQVEVQPTFIYQAF